ncbi:MAG: site-2 protease family protein [Corallococcus sp.]|nr:site-2 protease family protein [Corallococcus sp.]
MYIFELLTKNGNTPSREGLLSVIAFIVALPLTVILHEIAHGLVALWCGDKTAKACGRLSLNPIKHFDLYGFILMLLVGFGWAKPVPVNPNNFKHRKSGMILVSFAGIVTNLICAFVFTAFYVLMFTVGGVAFREGSYYFWYFLKEFFWQVISLNISFALFNVLPLYPLDGYRFVNCFVSSEKPFMRFLQRYSLYILLGLALLNCIPVVNNYSPLALYMNYAGNGLLGLFQKFWRLLIR